MVRRKTKRSRRRKFIKGRWIIVFILLAIPFVYFGKRIYKLIDVRQQENSLKREILIKEAENEVLSNRIDEYKKGNLLEAKARDELGMIKKNEKVYLILKK